MSSVVGSTRDLVASTRLPAACRSLMGIGALIAVAAQLLYQTRYQFGPIDEAYVQLRVAANLARGDGPVFNIGEHVEVTSSPLWTLLLSAALRLGLADRIALLILSLGSTAIAGAATALLGFVLGGRVSALLATALLVASPSYAAWTGSGVETPLSAAGFACAAASMLVSRTLAAVVWNGLFAGLLWSISPEMIACVPALILISAASMPRRRALFAMVCGAAVALTPVVLLFLIRHWYFGEWFPNAFYAKLHGAGFNLRLKGLEYIAHLALLHPVYTALAALAVVKGSKQVRMVFLLLASFLSAVAWTGGDGFVFARLALPALPLIAAMSATALVTLFKPQLHLFLATVALLAQVVWGLRGLHEFQRYMTGVVLADSRRQIGEFVRQLPQGTIATVEIGAIAHASGRPILDLVGLADKHIARAARLGGAAIGRDHADNAYVLGRAPELVLPLDRLTDEAITAEQELEHLNRDPAMWASAIMLLHDPRFLANYTARNYRVGDKYLRVWLRNDLVSREAAAEPPRTEGRDKHAEGERSVIVNGRARSYYVMPSTARGPVPLVLDFHGAAGSGKDEVGKYQLRLASHGEAVLVFPNGVLQTWDGKHVVGWDTRSSATEDIAFVRAIIAQVSKEHCVDRTRISAVGFSWGGWMANQVGCALGPDVIHAIVSSAGGGPVGPCVGPVKTMILHGVRDESELIVEGQKSREHWRSTNKCAAETTRSVFPGCLEQAACLAPLHWCEHPHGHEVPASTLEHVWDFLR